MTDSHQGRNRRIILFVAAVALLALGGRALAANLAVLAEHIAQMGALGIVAFIAGYAVASALFIPASILTIIAGAIFGLAAGSLWALSGAALGACISFLVARHVIGPVVERRLARHARLSAISRGVSEHGWTFVALLRLSPVIPFNVINVVMGVTRISFPGFMLACLAMTPVTILFTYYGTLAGSVAEAVRGQVHHGREYYVMLFFGLMATIAVTTVITRLAAKKLDVASQGESQDGAT